MEDNIGISVGIAQNGTNEYTIVETMDGSFYLNSRNYVGEKRRVGSWSRDQGITLGEVYWEETLIEPICQTIQPNTTRLEVIKTWYCLRIRPV